MNEKNKFNTRTDTINGRWEIKLYKYAQIGSFNLHKNSIFYGSTRLFYEK